MNLTPSERADIASKVTLLGSLSNLFLVILKLIAGILGRSSAMIADSIHSLSDFATDIVVLLSLNMTKKPIDETHDYGHGKFETLASLIIGISLFSVGAGIGWNAVKLLVNYFTGSIEIKIPGYIAVIAAAISIITKELLFQWTNHTAKKINCQAMRANAWHHRSDAFSSVATLAGITAAIILGDNWVIADPIAAVIVSALILKTAYTISLESINELLESSLSESKEEEIIKLITETKGVIDPHNLKTRKIGNNIAIDIHIRVDNKLLITEAHHIATSVEKNIRDVYGEETIISVHTEPDKKENQQTLKQ